jgi:hypothetical protein
MENINMDEQSIYNAVISSYLPDGKLDMNNRYKIWNVNNKFDFRSFDYQILSNMLNSYCEEYETKLDDGEWYSIFKCNGAYFEFYERGNRMVFIHSDNIDDLYDMSDIE